MREGGREGGREREGEKKKKRELCRNRENHPAAGPGYLESRFSVFGESAVPFKRTTDTLLSMRTRQELLCSRHYRYKGELLAKTCGTYTRYLR